VKRLHVVIELIAVLDWDVNVEAYLGRGCDAIGEDCFLGSEESGGEGTQAEKRQAEDYGF
jgi:hypothetical protein